MRHTTREILVNGVVYPMNTPESDLDGLTPGEAVSLAALGNLVDPNATEEAQGDEPENVSASDEPNASTDAPPSDAAATPKPAAKASRPPRKRK